MKKHGTKIVIVKFLGKRSAKLYTDFFDPWADYDATPGLIRQKRRCASADLRDSVLKSLSIVPTFVDGDVCYIAEKDLEPLFSEREKRKYANRSDGQERRSKEMLAKRSAPKETPPVPGPVVALPPAHSDQPLAEPPPVDINTWALHSERLMRRIDRLEELLEIIADRAREMVDLWKK